MIESSAVWSFEYLMGRWRPEIGDPSFMGWLTVGSYFVCAFIAFMTAVIGKKSDGQILSFWGTIGLLMTALGINKQLDLQSLVPEIGRQIARAGGFFEYRRYIQFWSILFFGISLCALFFFFVMRYRHLFSKFRLAFIGLFFLLCFIIIRAASFHHIDALLDSRIWGAKMNWILELTGIYLTALAGFIQFLSITPKKT